MVSASGTSRLNGTYQTTGEEQRHISSTIVQNDAFKANPPGTLRAEANHVERNSLRCTNTFKMGTWTVRGMNEGKLDIVKREMIRNNIDILGISELHWTGNGYFKSDDFMVYFSGNDITRRKGVAFIVNKKIANCLISYRPINDRIMAIQIRGKPLNLTLIQVYAPTTDATEDEIELFYAEIHKTLKQTSKKDIVYLMGDFNAKVGNKEETNIIGKFGLGERNEAGERLFQFCIESRMRITNTWFMQPKRRLYTWTSPNGQHRNQIDYILCNHKWKSSIHAVKTLPGSDCGSDHQLLIAKVKLRLIKIKKKTLPKKFDVNKITPQYTVSCYLICNQTNYVKVSNLSLQKQLKNMSHLVQ